MNPVANITEAQMGGRLIPRSLIDSNAEALTTAFRKILASETGVVLSGISVNVSRQDAPDNAVNPFWRESVLDLVIGTYVFFPLFKDSLNLTDSHMQTLELH